MIPSLVYDAAVDAACIYLVVPREAMVAYTIEAVEKTILLDFDKEDHLISIEVLGARSVLAAETLSAASRR